MSTQPSELRAGAPSGIQASQFGPLYELAGTWVGSGFNLISRPVQGNQVFALQVNATKEVLTFDPVTGPIPDRGSVQGDIDLFTMTYTQMVSDAVTSGLLHVESGMWVNVPETTTPNQGPTIARLATIPHGDSVLAQGTSFTVIRPEILEVNPMPLPAPSPVPPGYFPPPFQQPQTVTGPLPPGFDISNPNAALTSAIHGQNITNTIVLDVSTQNEGGILNIPFVKANANAVSLDAIFWIETVTPLDGTQPFLQLQYTQTVILNFSGINWPHISVATLVKN